MGQFNISNSKIDQLNNAGDNVKVANNAGPVVVSGADAAQATGQSSKSQVAPKPGVWSKLVGAVKAAYRWATGRPS